MLLSSCRNTRSAEKPTTPPTRTAPRRKASACCLGRDMVLARDEIVNGEVPVADRGCTSGGSFHRGRSRIDDARVGAAHLELARVHERRAGNEDERRRGYHAGPCHL